MSTGFGASLMALAYFIPIALGLISGIVIYSKNKSVGALAMIIGAGAIIGLKLIINVLPILRMDFASEAFYSIYSLLTFVASLIFYGGLLYYAVNLKKEFNNNRY